MIANLAIPTQKVFFILQQLYFAIKLYYYFAAEKRSCFSTFLYERLILSACSCFRPVSDWRL